VFLPHLKGLSFELVPLFHLSYHDLSSCHSTDAAINSAMRAERSGRVVSAVAEEEASVAIFSIVG